MYLLYVDESGDSGLCNGSPTDYMALSGMVVHELAWHRILEEVIDFRRGLRDKYGLKLRDEIHASAFIHHPGEVRRIPKSMRLRILREVLDFQAGLIDISIINVIMDKSTKPSGYDVFDSVWKVLVQRFHNTITRRNFPGPQNPQDYGLLVVDRTDEPRLRALTRRMRKYNPVPSHFSVKGYRHIYLSTIVEDPVHRNSLHSYFLQLADVNAYFLYQKHRACGYIKSKGARNYFDRLGPVLCTVASATDPQGIVKL